jgi:peptidoglycan hydrolase-like protein with peptidoglycan-binding domain
MDIVKMLPVLALAYILAVPAQAQSYDAHIASLLAQVRALQSQLAALEGGGFVGFTSNLTIGSSGREVTELQKFLIQEGHAIPAGTTGYFGAQTRAALAAFQAANGISPSIGYFGPLTRARVNAVIQLPAPVLPEPVDEDDEEDEEDEGENADEEDASVGDVETSAKTTTVNGEDNDYATFEIEVTLESFGNDIFLSQNGDTAFTYRIEDASNGASLGSATNETAVISSSADSVGNYYRIDENSEETFTITVTFDPLPLDEGKSVRLQLLTLEYDTQAAPPSSTWNALPTGSYETPATYIND